MILDDIIKRLLRYEYHKGYKIVDNHTNSSETAHLPYILKEREIKMLIHAALDVLMTQPVLLELVPPINILGDIHG